MRASASALVATNTSIWDRIKHITGVRNTGSFGVARDLKARSLARKDWRGTDGSEFADCSPLASSVEGDAMISFGNVLAINELTSLSLGHSVLSLKNSQCICHYVRRQSRRSI